MMKLNESQGSTEPAFHISFLSMRPERTRQEGKQILDLLTSKHLIYAPDQCEIWMKGEHFERRPISPQVVETLLGEWEGMHGPLRGFNLIRSNPHVAQFSAVLADYSYFDKFGLDLDTAYLRVGTELDETLELSKQLYDIVKPAWGEIGTLDMRRKITLGKVEFVPGIDLLKLGLPDLEWAVFFGPEYVEMFGREKLASIRSHRMEYLSDGGALLVLTASPFDFERDADNYNHTRGYVRSQLGEDAFYRGGLAASRFPKFRFEESRASFVRKSVEKWKSTVKIKPELRKGGSKKDRSLP